MKKPNILFITADQMRRDTLGCYGNGLVCTPNIDGLAARGVLYQRAYCQSPICIPSRVTMITGKTAQHHGATLHNTAMRENELTLGDVLRENGYRTHFVGKPHFSSQQNTGCRESIADWREGIWNGWNGPYAGFETLEMILGHSNPLLAHYGEWLRENHPQHIQKFIYENMRPIDVSCGQGVYKNDVPEEAYSSTYVGERSCAYIKERALSGEPFYCFASFPDPHWPICPPEPWFSMYDGLSKDQIADYITPYAGERGREESPPAFKQFAPYDGGGHFMQNPGDAYKITRAYWGSVGLIDKNVGKMLDTLKQCGIEDDTIVVFTADHGDYMGAHGMMAKGGFVWEEFINIPYIVSYPAKYKPNRSDFLLSLTDAVPTILESAGISPDALAADGVSHHDMLAGNGGQARDSAMVVHFANSKDKRWPDIHCLICGWHKLVYHAGSGKGELYELDADPRETKNLYEDPAYAQIRQRLTAKLLDELILERDMAPLQMTKKADHYGEHEMKHEKWKTEFDRFK
jgi:uncharacterized sulfatase